MTDISIKHMKISIITPAFNESSNLPLLYSELKKNLDSIGMDWEWLIVDDHSSDNTYDVASGMAGEDPRIKVWRFARNHGSHMALRCGFDNATGDCAVVMAADLQDPPETIPELVKKWREGFHVVWAVRKQREGEKIFTLGFSRLYYFLMRKFVGLKEIPSTGADFFLIDKKVLNTLRQFKEANVSILALLTWIGFKQTSIFYNKKARIHGKSGWDFEKKLKLVADSITSFTYKPLRWMSYLGFLVALFGIGYSIYAIIYYFFLGSPVMGWTSLIVAVLILGGLQMMMMGILGEYLWRSLDESRRRPRYIIECDASDQQPIQKEIKESSDDSDNKTAD